MMEINLLLRLLIAHLITDFLLQPESWVKDKMVNKIKSSKLIAHVVLTTLVAYAFSGSYNNWYIPAIIFLTHYSIDLIKTYLKDSFRNFIIDQLLHILVLVLLWLAVDSKWEQFNSNLLLVTSTVDFWLIASAYLFITWPLGIFIGKGTQKWRNQIAKDQESTTGRVIPPHEEQGLGLASAGKWIGICERVLILSFILLQQYTAIGFLMAAKSILRFSEKDNNTQLKTEYVLVGTLVSFTSSVIVGLLTFYFL